MTYHFRRRVKIAPGIHINASSSGLGLNIGPQGANVTMNKKGVYVNTGIPGTGISQRTQIAKAPHSPKTSDSEIINSNPGRFMVIFVSFFLGVAIPMFLDGSWWFLLIMPIIGIVIGFSIPDKTQKNSSAAYDVAAFVAEYERRNQILQESTAAFYNATDIITLGKHYNVLFDQMSWTAKKIADGYPLKVQPEECGFESSLNREYNLRTVEIVSLHFEQFQTVFDELKAENEREDSKIEFDILKNKAITLLKQHENRNESKRHIDEMLLI